MKIRKGNIKKTKSTSCNLDTYCYSLKLKGLNDRTTLVLSNTRELDRVPKTK